MSVPVLGVAILNRPELLTALVDSVDHEIDQMVVVDNGDVVEDLPFATVIAPGWNLGCGAAWNLIVKSTPLAPWWLITNHDIEFQPGSLAALEAAVDPTKAAVYHLLGFAAFAITPGAIERVGWFDENFHPAYCEDIDYSRRCELAGVPRIEVPDAPVSHVGSATIYGDRTYMAQNGRTYSANLRYYEAKWGGPMHGGETFATPFNGERDVRVHLARLRELAWARARE